MALGEGHRSHTPTSLTGTNYRANPIGFFG